MNTYGARERMPCHITDTGPEFEPPSAIEDGYDAAIDREAERIEMSQSDGEWLTFIQEAIDHECYVVRPDAIGMDYIRRSHAERLSALRKAWKRGDRETFAVIIFEMIASAYSQSAEEAMK